MDYRDYNEVSSKEKISKIFEKIINEIKVNGELLDKKYGRNIKNRRVYDKEIETYQLNYENKKLFVDIETYINFETEDITMNFIKIYSSSDKNASDKLILKFPYDYFSRNSSIRIYIYNNKYDKDEIIQIRHYGSFNVYGKRLKREKFFNYLKQNGYEDKIKRDDKGKNFINILEINNDFCYAHLVSQLIENHQIIKEFKAEERKIENNKLVIKENKEDMNTIVKFIVVSNSYDIKDSKEYIEKKLKKVEEKLTDYKLENLTLEEHLSLKTDYFVNFNYDNDKYRIYFILETYKNEKNEEEKYFEISINSNISKEKLTKYILNEEKDFINDLKVNLKEEIFGNENKKEGDKCIWLIDQQSVMYVLNIYPKIYAVENLCREFIYSVMIREYGANWYDYLNLTKQKDDKSKQGLNNKSNKHSKQLVNFLKDIDDKLMTLEFSDLLKIMQLKIKKTNNEINLWENSFSRYIVEKEIIYNDLNDFKNNRNHVAHNKLLNRSGYKKIERNINKSLEALEEALKKVKEENKSLEIKLEIKNNENDLDN